MNSCIHTRKDYTFRNYWKCLDCGVDIDIYPVHQFTTHGGNSMTYWDEWEIEAEAFMKGQLPEPPEAPSTRRVLLLLKACREVERVLTDPRVTAAMPQTYKMVKKALRA